MGSKHLGEDLNLGQWKCGLKKKKHQMDVFIMWIQCSHPQTEYREPGNYGGYDHSRIW